MDWFSSENELIWYLGITIVFFAFFIWNNTRLKRNRKNQKNRNFRTRYLERKKENSQS